jgi:membrane-bound ClpP family serine protease
MTVQVWVGFTLLCEALLLTGILPAAIAGVLITLGAYGLFVDLYHRLP